MAVSAVACFLAVTPVSGQGSTIRISSGPGGIEADRDCFAPALSGDGRFVAFESIASNLVAGDTNGEPDVFVHDLKTGITERVSVSTAGVESDGRSLTAAISYDGRFVAFASEATNLVPGDVNGPLRDVFVHDRAKRTTELVSVDSQGVQGKWPSVRPSISYDGCRIAFLSTSKLHPQDQYVGQDVYLRDRLTGTTSLVSRSHDGSPVKGPSYWPRISGDGRWISFSSEASNMVPGDKNADADAFVLDSRTGTMERVTLRWDGGELVRGGYSWSISADGRFVAFESWSEDAVPDKTSYWKEIFLRDRLLGTTERVAVAHDGSELDAWSNDSEVSGDGRYVTFATGAMNVFPESLGLDWTGNRQIYRREIATGDIVRISVSTSGVRAGVSTHEHAIDHAGQAVAFSSHADDLVPGDLNGCSDIFLRRTLHAGPFVDCAPKTNSLGCVPSICAVGSPSAQASSGFAVIGTEVRNQRVGLLLYSIDGAAALPVGGGMLCLAPPIRRTPARSSGGSHILQPDCSGSWRIDMSAFAAGVFGGDPIPELRTAGTTVRCQWWGRDPGFPPPDDVALTGALDYFVQP